MPEQMDHRIRRSYRIVGSILLSFVLCFLIYVFSDDSLVLRQADLVQDKEEASITPTPKYLFVQSLSPANTATTRTCTKNNQERLESPEYGSLHLEANGIPRTTFLAGESLRIPVYSRIIPSSTMNQQQQQQQEEQNNKNTPSSTPYNASNATAAVGEERRNYEYSLWARLVGTSMTIPFHRIDIYGNNPITITRKDHDLFADIEFHIWEADTYRLEIEVRYLYGHDHGMNWTLGNYTSLFTRNDSMISLDSLETFPYNQKVAQVFPQHYDNFINVVYMGRENDLQTWRYQYREKNTTEWGPFHMHWINNNCFSIHGSPYTLDIRESKMNQNDTNTKSDPTNNNSTIIPTSGTKETPPPPPKQQHEHRIMKEEKQCGISDTMKPGYWRSLQVNCTSSSDDNKANYHVGCGYIWERDFVGLGYLYETPGCSWKFLTRNQLTVCLEKIDYQLNFVGDSLIRLIKQHVERYLQFIDYYHLQQQQQQQDPAKQLTIRSDYKELGEQGSSVDQKSGHDFSMKTGGVFVDDFMVIHRVGFGSVGDMGGGESSPGRLAKELSLHKAWMDEQQQQQQQQSQRQNARLIYYVPHYINDYRNEQAFEPYMSFYCAMAGEFAKRHMGYEIFNANQLTRGIPEFTADGLHYSPEIEAVLALLLLNAIC